MEGEVFRGQAQPSMKEVALVQDIPTGASPPQLLSSSQAEPLQPSLAADGEDERWGAGMPRLTPGVKRRAKEWGRTCWQGGQSCSKPTCSCPGGGRAGFSWWDMAAAAPTNPTCSGHRLIFYCWHCQPGNLLVSPLFLASSCTLSTGHAGGGHARSPRMTKMLPLLKAGGKGFVLGLFFFFPKGFFQSHPQGCVSPLESHLHFYPRGCKCSWVQSTAQLHPQPHPFIPHTRAGRCRPPLFPRQRVKRRCCFPWMWLHRQPGQKEETGK